MLDAFLEQLSAKGNYLKITHSEEEHKNMYTATDVLSQITRTKN
jgi:hypothetical protein